MVDVGLPNDPFYFHVLLSPQDFLLLALSGEIALGEDEQPDYTGTERLRGVSPLERLTKDSTPEEIAKAQAEVQHNDMAILRKVLKATA
jgi:hypothetical protein